MTSAPGGLFHLQRSVADADDLIAESRHWNLGFRQLDRGEFQGELLQFVAESVQIAEARFRRALHQTGAPPSDLRTITDAQGRCRSATTPRRETALARALDFLEASIQGEISIRDVVEAAGVSPRTLENAFADRFGVTPKEYLSLIRLRGARLQLRQACSRRTRVADVAGQWVFWHMGQFAADYRRHFGELPSATLERKTDSGESAKA
jgi:transcriptional regulator GlxA family with amidase domain